MVAGGPSGSDIRKSARRAGLYECERRVTGGFPSRDHSPHLAKYLGPAANPVSSLAAALAKNAQYAS